jgi:hypothetical protein
VRGSGHLRPSERPDANVHCRPRSLVPTAIPFHLVQPWGRDTYHQATVISTHQALDAAYAELDRDGAPPEDYLEVYAVNERRRSRCHDRGH